jgi:hypothetical protein
VLRDLRDALARGGLFGLGAIFALAVAGAALASAMADLVVSVVAQNAGELSFTVHHTQLRFYSLVDAVVALIVLGAGIAYLFRLTSPGYRTCPDCLAVIPRAARVCRYCTSELANEEEIR